MRIHHTMGVYANGDRKHNGVAATDLEAHIDYNLKMRPGRALFVDGKCVHRGYLTEGQCKQIEHELTVDPILMDRITTPYH